MFVITVPSIRNEIRWVDIYGFLTDQVKYAKKFNSFDQALIFAIELKLGTYQIVGI